MVRNFIFCSFYFLIFLGKTPSACFLLSEVLFKFAHGNITGFNIPDEMEIKTLQASARREKDELS